MGIKGCLLHELETLGRVTKSLQPQNSCSVCLSYTGLSIGGFVCGFGGVFCFVREQDMAANVIDFGRQRGDILIELSITECKWIGTDWCVSVNR